MASSIAYITHDHNIKEIKNVYKASDAKTNVGTITPYSTNIFKTPKKILDGENIPHPGYEHYDGTPRSNIITSNYGEGFIKSKFSTDDYKLTKDSDLSSIIEKINRLEYKGSNMGIYRGLKDVIYMNIPCNIYSSSDNLEQQSYYKLSLILDEYKRILKEEQEINMGNELVIFKDCLQKAVKNIADTL